MIKVLRLTLWWLVLCLFLWRSVYSGTLEREPLKSGTDAAGYAITAQAIREGASLGAISKLKDSTISDLAVDVANRNGVMTHHNETTLAPNSFTYNWRLKEHISQYPPGTAWLLSRFPEAIEVRLLTIETTFITVFLMFFGLSLTGKDKAGLESIIGIYGIVLLWVQREYLSHSFSLHPSAISAVMMGILGGYILSTENTGITRRPISWLVIATLGGLLGLAIAVRTGNIFLLVPLVSCIFYTSRKQVRLSAYKLFVFTAGICIGISPLIVWSLSTSDRLFLSNYPSYDKAFAGSLYAVYGNIERLALRSGIDSMLIVGTLIGLVIVSSDLEARDQRIKGFWRMSLAIFSTYFLLISSKLVVTPYYISTFCIFYCTLLISRLIIVYCDVSHFKLLWAGSLGFGLATIASTIAIVPYLGHISSDLKLSLSKDMAREVLAKKLGLEDAQSLNSLIIWSNEELGFLYHRYGVYGLRNIRMDNSLAIALMNEFNNRGFVQYLEGSWINTNGIDEAGRITINGSAKVNIDHLSLRRINFKQAENN